MVNPKKWGEGGADNHPPLLENCNFSGPECLIDLKPDCKFKFFHCLGTYLIKLISLGIEGSLFGPFFKNDYWVP